MSKIFLSSSSNSVDKAIDEYHDTTSFSGSSSDSNSGSNNSSGRNTTDEEYTSSIPRIPLEVFQEQLRTRDCLGLGLVPQVLLHRLFKMRLR